MKETNKFNRRSKQFSNLKKKSMKLVRSLNNLSRTVHLMPLKLKKNWNLKLLNSKKNLRNYQNSLNPRIIISRKHTNRNYKELKRNQILKLKIRKISWKKKLKEYKNNLKLKSNPYKRRYNSKKRITPQN